MEGIGETGCFAGGPVEHVAGGGDDAGDGEQLSRKLPS